MVGTCTLLVPEPVRCRKAGAAPLSTLPLPWLLLRVASGGRRWAAAGFETGLRAGRGCWDAALRELEALEERASDLAAAAHAAALMTLRLTDPSAQVQEQAAVALWHISAHSEGHKVPVVVSGAVQPVWHLCSAAQQGCGSRRQGRCAACERTPVGCARWASQPQAPLASWWPAWRMSQLQCSSRRQGR